ncbi:hypothetical protein DEO72_LG5g1631 [Vigna unguiculata]|uniref:Uncharacterized protein n=1 Tax=Vigna unguiculata TaxID=3917 RepID=A0A4D6LZZ3_VIGUN|nr:hypothetical protein DEO72_LG5g1631 [Vigna unguiculata]
MPLHAHLHQRLLPCNKLHDDRQTHTDRKCFLAHNHLTKTAWRASHAARQNLGPDRLAGITHRQAPSANRIIIAPSPPGGLHPTARRLAVRHCLAYPSRAARCQPPSRPSISPFCLAEPSLAPSALLAE